MEKKDAIKYWVNTNNVAYGFDQMVDLTHSDDPSQRQEPAHQYYYNYHAIPNKH